VRRHGRGAWVCLAVVDGCLADVADGGRRLCDARAREHDSGRGAIGTAVRDPAAGGLFSLSLRVRRPNTGPGSWSSARHPGVGGRYNGTRHAQEGWMKVSLVHGKYFNSWEALGLGYIGAYLKAHVDGVDVNFYQGCFDDDETILSGCAGSDVVAFS